MTERYSRRSLAFLLENESDENVKLANAIFVNDYEAVKQILVEHARNHHNAEPPRPGPMEAGQGSSTSLNARTSQTNPRTAHPVTMAASHGREKILTLLLEYGYEPNEPDRTDFMWFRRPIHLAASQGHVACLHVLLDAGVDVNTKDNDNRTPLHWTCTYGRVPAAEVSVC